MRVVSHPASVGGTKDEYTKGLACSTYDHDGAAELLRQCDYFFALLNKNLQK